MRQAYIVTYDICEPKRLRRVFELMKGYGIWLQLSVFRCELNARETLELRHRLSEEIDPTVDQVLFVDIGPADGRGESAIDSVGRPYVPADRRPIVL